MAFPGLHVEADLDGWTSLTSDLYKRAAVGLTDGRSNEASQVEPSSLSMLLGNRTGKYSPRNPRGAYFGLIGRNTPVRAYVERGPVALEVRGGTDRVSAPDSTGLSITGDIDVRVDMTSACWSQVTLAGKYKEAGDQRSWALQTRDDGTLSLVWTTAGTSASAALAASTMPIPLHPGRRAVRAVLDVNNGAGSNTTVFYVADTIAGPWTQLGDPIVGALGTTGTTSIYDSTAPVEVGQVPDIPNIAGFTMAPRATIGRLNAFELRNSSGTVVADPDFTAQAAGASSFTDAAGVTWTLQGAAAINNRHWLGHYELSQLPPTANVSGKDVTVSAQAGGLLRRLGQGSTSLRSTIFRGVLSEDAVESYWPCEDGGDATGLGSGLTRGQPMTISGDASLGGSSVFAASEALPTVGSSSWTGQVTTYAPTGTSQVRFLLAVPAAGTVNNAVLARVYTTGRAAQWDIIYTTTSGGSLNYIVYDSDGNVLLPAGGVISGYNGELLRISLDMTQNGTAVDGTLWALRVGDQTGVGSPGTITSATFSRVKAIVINPNKAALSDVTVGHISAHSAITDLFDLADELTGYIGETAGRRVERLCAEQGIAFAAIGSMDDTAAMGVQRPGELGSLLQESADADLGVLFEPRQFLGLGYRARSSMYNQPARAALTFGQMSAGLVPVDDDQLLRNDMTASRTGGSSARFEETEGPNSVADPPDGAGRYDDGVTVNVASDQQLLDQAAWRVHMGTVEDSRYPSIPINFAAPPIRVVQGLDEDLLDLELGDRVTIDDPPDWLPPEQISQLLQGRTVTLLPSQHSMTLTGAPESPYRIAVYDNADRYGTAGSELAASPPEAPTFVDAEPVYWNLASIAVTPIVGAGTVVVCLSWNTTADITAPAGWTLVETLTETSSRAAVFTAPGDIADWTFTLTAISKTSVIALGYSASEVTASDGVVDAGSDATHEAPALTVPDGPARLVRFYWDKASTTTAWTANDGTATVRASQFGTGSGSDALLATDQVVSAGTAPSASATADVAANQAGGFTLALVSTEEPSGDGVSDTDTTLSVATTRGPLWTTNPDHLPLDVEIGGERMTVTAITGSSSPQSFTVTRGINGFAGSHPAGTPVRLAAPTYRRL